jgi:hypothetical protein
MVTTAQQHDAHPLSLLQTVPRSSVSCSCMPCMLSRASHGARFACPPAGSSHAPRHLRASGRGPPARRAARPSSRGPCPQRPSCASGTSLRANSLWPAERPSTGRARPGPWGRISGPEPSLTGYHGRGRSSAPPFARAQGGEPARLQPHGGALGAAWPRGAGMLDGVRRRTLRRTEALCPAPARVMGRGRSRLSLRRQGRMVMGCCPSPAPGPHGRTERCRHACA